MKIIILFYIMDTGMGTFYRSYPSFKLEHSLEPIVMACFYDKSENKFTIKDIRSNEQKIGCFCVKGEISSMGKLIWVVGIMMVLGIGISLFLAIRINKARSKLAVLKNNPADNLN